MNICRVIRKEEKLIIHSEKDILSMCIFNIKGNCLWSKEYPDKELKLSGIEEGMLIVLNFIGGDYLATMINQKKLKNENSSYCS
ncbi:hypothetical protein E9993_15465 [Labilibacter sediminis]|nr:hypothetical protein E9993_15465 [Labilibacter sediminis]